MSITSTNPTNPSSPEPFWSDADLIHSYTRRQAIADGVLVQLSGPDLSADDMTHHGHWTSRMVAEAGFRFPIAMTCEAWRELVVVNRQAYAVCNDESGRLWDVLWMFRDAIRKRGNGNTQGGSDVMFFTVMVVVAAESQWRKARRLSEPSQVRVKAVCGPGDDGEPVVTLMMLDQD